MHNPTSAKKYVEAMVKEIAQMREDLRGQMSQHLDTQLFNAEIDLAAIDWSKAWVKGEKE